MKAYWFLFINDSINANIPYTQKLQICGSNAGNLLFMSALRGQLKGNIKIGRIEYCTSNENECIVIPSSNFLNDFSDFGFVADDIEKSNYSCLMAGVGAQSSSYKKIPKLKAGTLRFMKVVAERTKVIGVRGEFSADVLAHYGIKNVHIIGCPSLFTNGNKIPKIKTSNIDINKIVINGSRNVPAHSFSPERAKNIEDQLLKIAFKNKRPYILQNEMPEIAVLDCFHNNQDIDKESLDIIHRLWNIDNSEKDEFNDYFANKIKVFFSTNEWFEFIKNFDFVLGTRFHGCMAALINDVPAFMITHDTRTDELANLLKIPHKTINEVDKINIEEIIENTDYSKFEKNYLNLFNNYVDFLDINGIEHKLS